MIESGVWIIGPNQITIGVNNSGNLIFKRGEQGDREHDRIDIGRATNESIDSIIYALNKLRTYAES